VGLAFITAEQNVASGACSSLVTVEARDAFDASVPFPTSTLVTFSAVSSGVLLYADALGCNNHTPIDGGVTVAANAPSASVVFRSSLAGANPVTASSVWGTVSQVNHVGQKHLALGGVPQTLNRPDCYNLTVESRDANDLLFSSGLPLLVALDASPPGCAQFVMACPMPNSAVDGVLIAAGTSLANISLAVGPSPMSECRLIASEDGGSAGFNPAVLFRQVL
jgi:hypothetical protein